MIGGGSKAVSAPGLTQSKRLWRRFNCRVDNGISEIKLSSSQLLQGVRLYHVVASAPRGNRTTREATPGGRINSV